MTPLGEAGATACRFMSGAPDMLYVTFTSFSDRHAADGFWGKSFFLKSGASALGFVAAQDHWFPHAEMAALLPAVRPILGRYQRIVCYGFSMGAYAALKYARAVGAETVIAIAPQASIAAGDVGTFDTRFLGYYREDWHRDMRVTAGDVSGRLYLIHDPRERMDRLHASLLATLPGAETIVTPFAGHEILSFLDYDLPRSALDGGRALRQAIRERRRASPYYHLGLGKAHERRGRMADASRALETALTLRPDLFETRCALITFWNAVGETERARQALDAIEDGEIGRLDQIRHLAGLRQRLATPARHRATVEAGLRRWPEDGALRLAMARLLLESGDVEGTRRHLAALEKAPPLAAVMRGRIALLEQLGDIRAAWACCATLLLWSCPDKRMLLESARLAALAGETAEARILMERAAAMGPHDPAFWRQFGSLAFTLRDQGLMDHARDRIRAAALL